MPRRPLVPAASLAASLAATALAVAACGSSTQTATSGSSASSQATAAPTATGSGGDVATGRTTPPPWDPPANASQFITAAGLPPMTQEAVDVHYHAHLDIFADGQPVTVAPYIGIDVQAQRISPLHTHDTTGVVHIESPKQDKFTLGQLFTEWDVRLTSTCIGGLCAGGGKSLAFYVDGKPYTGDPRALVFVAHQEIAIVYGSPPSKIPSTYDFGQL